jgi:hypothetical protein
MKTGSLVSAGVFFLLFTVASAQAQTRPVTKVLPTNGKGVIKLLVAENQGRTVSVKFYNDDGIIASDEIQGKDARGFIKKYDLSRLLYGSFWMEVNTETASFVYAITKTGNEISAELRESTQTYPIIAAR